MTDSEKIMEVMLANNQMDGVARYLSRGRRLQSLDEPTLKQLWIDEVWRAVRERGGDRVLREEICAELSLRRINRVELPSDLQAAMQAAIDKRWNLPNLWWTLETKLLLPLNAYWQSQRIEAQHMVSRPLSKVDH
jgi:hypothetical protein